MASALYNSAKVKLGNGSIDWDTDTIKMALVQSTYTPNIDSHVFFSDITNEASGTGYSTGGFALASPTVTQDNTNDRAIYSANDVSQSGLTVSFQYAVVYKSTGVAATSPLVCIIDFGSTQTLVSYILQIAFGSAGIFNLT